MSAAARDARRTLGERARAWIDASLDEFAVTPDGEDAVGYLKRHGELAMVAGLLLDRAEDPVARRWLDLAWERYERGGLLARQITQQPGFIAMYSAFHRHGHTSSEVERAIAEALPRAEDPTLRLLLACSLASIDLDTPWALDQLLEHSVLAREPATWLIDDLTGYVITHIVLLAPADAILERHRGYLARSLPAWIAQFVRAGNLDLVGELIMVSHALGTCVPDCEWQVLVDAQESDGLVPFRAAWRGRPVPPRIRFVANYHSTLVACAAVGMCRCA